MLKNAIDHASRPHGQSAWAGKPAGVLAFIQAKDGLFDEAGNIGAGSRPFLQTWMDRYGAWVKHHTAEPESLVPAEAGAAAVGP